MTSYNVVRFDQNQINNVCKFSIYESKTNSLNKALNGKGKRSLAIFQNEENNLNYSS